MPVPVERGLALRIPATRRCRFAALSVASTTSSNRTARAAATTSGNPACAVTSSPVPCRITKGRIP